jgi:hypothetical protein
MVLLQVLRGYVEEAALISAFRIEDGRRKGMDDQH